MVSRSRILSVAIGVMILWAFGTEPIWAVDWNQEFSFVGNDLDFFPEVLAGIGDINGDNVPDVLGGTPLQVGRYVILSGATGAALRDVTDPGFDHQGSSVAAYGDYNGDGVPDYLVGAPFADPGGEMLRARSGSFPEQMAPCFRHSRDRTRMT